MPYNAYWTDMSETVFRLECLMELRSKTKFMLWATTLTVGISSCIASCVWLGGILSPAVCNTLIFVFQIAGIVLPFLKYGETLSALNFMIPDVQRLLLDMESSFLLIDELTSENEIVTARKEYLNHYFDLENKYLTELMPKFSKGIIQRATLQRDAYLKEHFYKNESEVTT